MIGSALGERIAVEVGLELRRLRQEHGVSLRQLAKRLGSFGPVLSRLEHGNHCPSLSTATMFAESCGGSALNVARAIDRALELEAFATTTDIRVAAHKGPLRRVPRRVAVRARARVLVTPVPANAALEPQALH